MRSCSTLVLVVALDPEGFSLARTEAGRRTARAIADRMLATLHDGQNLPRDRGALIVGNHAYLGLDSFALSALLLAELDVLPRFLADRNLFRIPVLRSLLTSAGVVSGSPDDAVALLESGEIVAVYPGGVDDSFKLSSQAYTLQWRGRSGFVRVAMRAGVPIVPIAATGVDEVFRIDRREHSIGRRFGGSPRYDLPLPRPRLPHRVPLDFYVLPPIETCGDVNDPSTVERIRSATVDALRRVLDPYRERLARIDSP